MSVVIVAAVKQDLVDAGEDLAGPCGAFKITSRVAWEMRNEGWGLIYKTSGQNGCTVDGHERYAVDALLNNRTGETVDILISSETENIPAWQATGAAPLTLWRAPFDQGDPTDPPEKPPTDCPCATAARLEDLIASINAQDARVNEKLDKILQKLEANP